MAAKITVLKAIAFEQAGGPQVASDPVQNFDTGFDMPINGLIRVYAQGADVTLTLTTGVPMIIPAGGVEYFGVRKGQAVGVA